MNRDGLTSGAPPNCVRADSSKAGSEPVARSPRRASCLATAAVRSLVPVAVAAAVVGCGASAVEQPSGAKSPAPEERVCIPQRTASDVVSYADHVAIVTAVGEREERRSGRVVYEDKGRLGKGIVRRATIRVDDVLWSREDARPAPKRFSMTWGGWLVGRERHPYVPAGAIYGSGMPPFFLDSHYVMAIAFTGKTFLTVEPWTTMRFAEDDGVIWDRSAGSFAKRFRGDSRKQVAKVLASAVPDPSAVRDQDTLLRELEPCWGHGYRYDQTPRHLRCAWVLAGPCRNERG